MYVSTKIVKQFSVEGFSWNYDILLLVLDTFTFDKEELCLDLNSKVYHDRAQNLNIHIHGYKKSQQKQLFLLLQRWKNKYGGYLSCFNYFSSFGLSVSNTKNQIKAMISFHILLVLFLLKLKNQFLHNFYGVFIQIYSKYKKYLTHRGTPACSKTLHTTIWFWV